MEGRVLAGRYRLLSQLGRGGMGSVWRAEHIELGTPTAIKLIDESFVQAPEALTRFRREAQAAASLRSANVVQILDYGIDGETPYIAMELLEGESLADRIERLGRIDPAECAAILLQVSKALSKAHDMGIVHRDLKPDNVFLVRDGDDEIAKVLDFGIAKRTGTLQTSSDMATRTGSLMGTPYYMSPEQASGRRQVDQRTDIWAFAVIAYECLTGRRPFDDTNLGGLLLSICTEMPAPPSSVLPLPPGFDAWFTRCTAKDPAARFDNIREAAIELCRAIGQAVPTARAFAQSLPGEAVPPQQVVVQSVTSPWGASRGSASVATPGGVIMADTAGSAATLARGKRKRPPFLLIATGSVAALGTASAIAAIVWRGFVTSGSGAAPSASEPSVSPEMTQPALATPPVATRPPETNVPAPEPSVAPAASDSGQAIGGAAQRPRTRTPVVVPRQSTRRVPTADPANSGRLRPQDRLERDLGF